jgi:hypothetical protein
MQSDGVTPQSLVGITVGCTVKINATDLDTAATFQSDIPGDATGIIKFTITPQNPGDFVLDIKWWNTNQSNQRQTVVGTMPFHVNQSTTARALP